MADHDISKMKVADLKRELKVRGLNVTGNKNDLVERLQSALIEGDVLDDTAISEELLDDNDDVLNDDELDEETKSYLNSASVQDEDAILSSPKGSSSSKSPENASENSANVSSVPAQHKKIVLKRKLLPSISLTEKEETKTSTESKIIKIDGITDEVKSSNGSADGNVVKLSQLTMKERLELRAKKFGAPVTGDVAKLARAERFGNVTAPAKTDNSITQNNAPNLDVLKKRAERFGGSVSNAMTTIEQKEKLLKRQERFGNAPSTVTTSTTTPGTVTPSTATPVSTEVANEYEEKAKLRLERFKTAA